MRTTLPRALGAGALVLATSGGMTLSSGAGAAARVAEPATSTGVSLEQAAPADSLLLAGAMADRGLRVSRDSSRQAMEDKVELEAKPPESGQAKEANAELAKLAALAEKAAGQIAKNAWQLPIAAGVYHLTAGFGQCSSLWAHCHTGLDFAAPEGTPILSVANGTVTEVGWAGAYGNRTVMTLDDGTDLWYCHQSAIGVNVGEQVVGGQPIGAVGSTGNTTGPHLHLEVRPGGGDAVDPDEAMIVHGVTP